MIRRLSLVLLIAMAVIAFSGCASVQVEDEHGGYGVSTY